MVEKLNQHIVIICCLGGPRNSVLVRCSSIQTIVPTKRKRTPRIHHIWKVNGFRNAQAFGSISFAGATIMRPDSIYGWVKSTSLVLFVTIVMSPIAASKH
uniref:Uncharacterized protein n=1 Tax=Arundo donax TaxID=35708 RepID=A0A0A9EJA8_ARUDO